MEPSNERSVEADSPACFPALGDLPGDGRIIVAFSGGPDSVCLAALLARAGLKRSIECIHVDHGLDPESRERAKTAARLSAELGLSCRIETVQVHSRSGIEASARKARYACLADHVEGGDVLVTAHHADDQAETILMRLIRGAGSAGMAGIPRLRRFARGWLARPLLDWSREEIRAWLEHHDLEWLDDPANQDPAMDRNYITHEIMPAILARWPGAVDSIRRSGRLAEGASRVLAEVSLADCNRFAAPGRRLQRAAVERLDDFRFGELLRQWCHQMGHAAPPASRLEEFINQLHQAATDRQPEMRWDESVLRAHDQWLRLEHADDIAADWFQHWSGRDPLVLPGRLGSLQMTPPPSDGGLELTVCLGRHGEKLQLEGHDHPVAVRKLMQRSGVPPWHRDLWPRLWLKDSLVAVGDRWMDHDFSCHLKGLGCTLEWRTDLFQPGVESRP